MNRDVRQGAGIDAVALVMRVLQCGSPGVGRLVLLHGWGANAEDLLALGQQLMAGLGEAVALDAQEAHGSAPNGYQWYDLSSGDFQTGWPGSRQAVADLNKRLAPLAQSACRVPTVVLGFSQGAAMALEVTVDFPLVGIVACSGYPHPGHGRKAPAAPVLLIHGRQDPVVPVQASGLLLDDIQAQGGNARLMCFDCEHTIPADALGPMRRFLEQCFAAGQGS